MKKIFLFLLLPVALQSSAQYYYNDIIGTEDANYLITDYREANLRTVEVISFEANGSPSRNFSIRQQFDAQQQLLQTFTSNGTEQSVLSTYFNQDNRITRTVDSSGRMINTTSYVYAPNGLVQSITHLTTSDSLGGLKESEEHTWTYNAEGQPQKMVRTINNQPSLEISFAYDEAGNVSEEIWKKNGVEMDRIFYYYDEFNYLTDIVRFNKKAGRLLPDYMFEYDEDGRVIQKIVVPTGSSDYQIWRYQYNDKGLKIREALYNKEKQLVGKVEYKYGF